MRIALLGMKGGVGKTTLAIHIAEYLGRNMGTTAIIDGDPNRSAYQWYERSEAGEQEQLQKHTHFKVLTERQAAMQGVSAEHIIFDTQARPSADDLRELAPMIDFFLLPTQPNAVSIAPLALTIAELKKIKVAEEGYAIVLNQVPSYPSTLGADIRVALQDAELPLLKTQIGQRLAFAHAGAAGITAAHLNTPGGKQAWTEIEQLTQEMVGLMTKLTKTAQRKG